MSQAHAHPHRLDARRADSSRRMCLALGVNLVLLGAGVAGGIVFGSVAVLADAGHVLSDVGSIGIGIGAAMLAARPSDPSSTFGLQRSEVFAALINGLVLVAVAALVAIESLARLGDPPSVDGGGVLAVGLLGLAGNLVAAAILAGGDRGDLNLQGVLRHSFADALGSLGVLLSGALVLIAGWDRADPIAGLAIAALILASSVRLVFEPLGVLMERAPRDVDVQSLGTRMCGEPGVVEVHDLHVWTITSGFPALAAHVVLEPGMDRDLIRNRLEALIHEHSGIEHTTLQMVERPRTAPLQIASGR